MPSKLHEQLSAQASKWAKKQGFPVVATGIHATGSRERVDVIAFRSTCSLLIESKVSRADFKADFKKPERVAGGVGVYRFYITPVNLVTESELPQGWGLLYLDGNKVIEVYKPKGNWWKAYQENDTSDWHEFMHSVDQSAERAMLFSITRRLVIGESILK